MFISLKEEKNKALLIGMYGFIYSKPSPVGEGGIRAFASMTDEVFAFSSSNFPSGMASNYVGFHRIAISSEFHEDLI